MMFGHYEPVEWERISLKDGKWVPAKKNPPEKPSAAPPGKDLLGSVDSIRNLIRDNRELVLLVIAVLIVCDCDDSVEMLIALAVLLYPYILHIKE